MEAIERFVAASLLPALGLEGRSSVEAITQGGTRSAVHLIRLDGSPAFLLRSWARRDPAARTVLALRHLDALGLPAPRVVWWDLARWRGLLPGSVRSPYRVVESWIEGTRFSSIAADAERREASLGIAGVLALYHAVTRARWGRLDRPSLTAWAGSAVRQMRRMIGRLQRHRWLDADEARRLSGRIDAWRPVIARIHSFSLTHSDPNRHNFVRTPGGAMIPVDLHRVGYRPFAEELVNAVYEYCRKDPPLTQPFLDAYFARAGAEARRSFDESRRFFELLHFVRKMHRRSQTRSPGERDANVEQWRRLILTDLP
jgi:hypothetical protein